jgi:hypothetical protein
MQTETIVESSATVEMLSTRYRSAYSAAKAIRALGMLIRVAAIVLAVLMLAAIITGFCGFCTGLLVSALSHQIKSSADTAINTSPLLSVETKDRLLAAD